MLSNPRLLLALILCVPFSAIAQQRAAAVCSEKGFAAFKPLPELSYECPEANDSDEQILQMPERVKRLKNVLIELAAFNNPDWWRTSTDELNVCDALRGYGKLSKEEFEQMLASEFRLRIFGDDRFRLVIVFDPCYQSQFNGSNLFLMYRPQARVFVSQLVNGFYTRAENSVGMNVGQLNGRPIIELTTANTMPPQFTNYYFAIDPKTNQALPYKMFREVGKLSNRMDSAMLMDDARNTFTIFRNKQPRRTVAVFSENEKGRIVSAGQRFRRLIYRWNGKFYQPD